MPMIAGQFERVADAVTEQAAELLDTQVLVIDKRGTVLASSTPALVGHLFDLTDRAPEATLLRIPIHLDGQAGEVIVAEPANGEVISPRLAQALVEHIVNKTAAVARLPNQHELKNKFIHDLLRGAGGDEADIVRDGQILGMDLTRPRAVILIDAAAYILPAGASHRPDRPDRPDSSAPAHASTAPHPPLMTEARAQRRAQLVIASIVGFFNLPDDTICAYIGDGEIAVLKASSTQDLAAWTDHADGVGKGTSSTPSPSWGNLTLLKRAGAALVTRLRRDTGAAISIGIGRYHPGVQGLARSYQDARAALSLGRRFHGHNGVHCLDGLGIAAFVGISDERTKIELATHLLSPLDQEPDLLASLDAFFVADCCPSSTALRLSIHRNTLAYRLDKITSLSGLDPRRFDDAVQIRLALLLRTLGNGSM